MTVMQPDWRVSGCWLPAWLPALPLQGPQPRGAQCQSTWIWQSWGAVGGTLIWVKMLLTLRWKHQVNPAGLDEGAQLPQTQLWQAVLNRKLSYARCIWEDALVVPPSHTAWKNIKKVNYPRWEITLQPTIVWSRELHPTAGESSVSGFNQQMNSSCFSQDVGYLHYGRELQ